MLMINRYYKQGEKIDKKASWTRVDEFNISSDEEEDETKVLKVEDQTENG